MKERIVLGSGKLYATTASKGGDGQYTIPEKTSLEKAENLLGWIQGGATLEYTPSFYTAKDDLGMVSKKYLTEEEATLKSGVMTWNADVLKKLVATGTKTIDTINKTETLKIGGIANFDNTQYVLRFVHEDKMDGNIRITIVGSNEAGFEMSFAKDKETVINAEFKALPHDNAGTLVEVEWETK